MTFPKPGCYGVVDAGGWMSPVIKLVTRSRVSHAFVVISETEVIEARPRGAGIAPLAHYIAKGAIFNSDEPIPDEIRAKIVAAAHGYIGTPYGFLDILALGLREGFGVRWGWLRRRVQDSRRMICSQLVCQCYADAGHSLFPNRDPQDVTPGGLLIRDAEAPWAA